MTAYELAQYLEVAFYLDEDIEKAITMLRQQVDQLADQQTTINFLEAECAALRKQLNEA